MSFFFLTNQVTYKRAIIDGLELSPLYTWNSKCLRPKSKRGLQHHSWDFLVLFFFSQNIFFFWFCLGIVMRCKFCLKFFFCLCFGVCGVELIPSKLRFYFRVCDFFVDVFKIVANFSNWTVCLFFFLLKINLLFQFILLPSRCFWKLLRMLLFLRFIAVFLCSCCVFVFFLSFLLQLWWGDYCYKGKKKK